MTQNLLLKPLVSGGQVRGIVSPVSLETSSMTAASFTMGHPIRTAATARIKPTHLIRSSSVEKRQLRQQSPRPRRYRPPRRLRINVIVHATAPFFVSWMAHAALSERRNDQPPCVSRHPIKLRHYVCREHTDSEGGVEL